MAITQNTFTGDGSNLGPFSFTFKWLEPTDIKVTVAGVLKTAGTHYNLQSLNYTTKTGGQVLFTAGNAPANGAAIVIYRQTDDTDLASTFYSGSAIRAQDLNDNFIQGLYVTQESSNNAASATSTANSALTNSNTAISTANAATATANTASSNASAAVATANTASSNASAAVSTANTASSNATSAVNTANAATATANSASSTAATALSTANAATSTANAASTAATNAVNTANAASATASSAVSTANTASSNASAAVATANTASSNASTALSTANSALSTANAAASAVANAILYDIVANVAAIPGSPANNDAVEVTDSTGIESFTPLSGVPVGFVGSSGLSVRIVYTTTGNTWTWIQYFPSDPESRYFKLSGGTLTGPLLADDSTSVASPVIAFDGDTNTGIAHTGADELALVTGGTARLTIDPSGNVAVSGGLAAASLIPHSSTVPTNGVYLPSANTVAISSNGTGRLFVDASGNVSVGTTTKASNTHFDLYSTSSYAQYIRFRDEVGAPGLIGYSHTDDSMQFYTSGLERIRVDSSGRLGLGTSSPGQVLTVYGTVNDALVDFTNGDTTNGYGLNVTAGGSASGRYIAKFNNASGTARAIILANGNVGIGTTSPAFGAIDHGVHIYGSGAQEGIRLETTNGSTGILEIYAESGGNTLDTRGSGYLRFSSATTEWGRWDSNGRFLVGTSSARSIGLGSAYPALFQVETTNFAAASFTNNSNDVQPAYLNLGKSRGGIGSNTIVQSGDFLGQLGFAGADGTDLETLAATITCVVDGTPGANDMPGRLVFSTTSDSASSPTERLRIANTGALGLSGANYGSSGQVLTSQGSGAAPQWADAGGGAWEYISSVTASGTTVEFTSIDSTYKTYVIQGSDFYPAGVQGESFCMRTSSNNGSSYDSSSGNYQFSNIYIEPATPAGGGGNNFGQYIGNSESRIDLTASAAMQGTGGTPLNQMGGFLTIYLHDPSNTSRYKLINGRIVFWKNYDNTYSVMSDRVVSGTRLSASAINAVRFYWESGASFGGGTFHLYGLKTS